MELRLIIHISQQGFTEVRVWVNDYIKQFPLWCKKLLIHAIPSAEAPVLYDLIRDLFVPSYYVQ